MKSDLHPWCATEEELVEGAAVYCDDTTYRPGAFSGLFSNPYRKPFPYKEIDIYRVLEIYNVTSPPLQHAIKKLLCAGQRGYKEIDKDVEEAIQSLQRYQEMQREESKI